MNLVRLGLERIQDNSKSIAGPSETTVVVARSYGNSERCGIYYLSYNDSSYRSAKMGGAVQTCVPSPLKLEGTSRRVPSLYLVFHGG